MNVSIHRGALVPLTLALVALAAPDLRAGEAAASAGAGFRALDVNHDGVVSKYEYDGDRAFALLDGDHDGKLSADELQALLGAPVDGVPTAAERIVIADLDADGKLDENELRRAAEMRYGAMDRNGDGNLDQDEFAAGFGVRVR